MQNIKTQADLIKALQDNEINPSAFINTLSRNLSERIEKFRSADEATRISRTWELVCEIKDDAEKIHEIATEQNYSLQANERSFAIGYYVASNY